MQESKFFRLFIGLFAAALLVIAGTVFVLDPFFHYRAPNPHLYYTLSDKRYQNDGITKHFSYDAVITGSSMCENFLTSEFDRLFGVKSVKLPYPGATFKEVNDNLKLAFETHEVRVVLRPLDYSHLVEDKDLLRTDMGDYPTYLTDGPGPNDVRYLVNGTVLTNYCLPMIADFLSGKEGGVESFDSYGSTAGLEYSADNVLGTDLEFGEGGPQQALTEEEKQMLRENIEQNVVSLVREHPECTFYYYFTPYSAAWMGYMRREGGLLRQIEAERIAAEAMLTCPNLRLYSFMLEAKVTTNLNNYRDPGHYSPEISRWIMKQIYKDEGTYELTQENLDEYIRTESELYMNLTYDYLNFQRKEFQQYWIDPNNSQ